MTRTEQRALLAKEIGRLLRARREELGLSLEQVAGAADMTANALWLNEVGRRIPGADTLIKLAHALQMEETPLSAFAKISWEQREDGVPGWELVVAMREYLQAAQRTA